MSVETRESVLSPTVDSELIDRALDAYCSGAASLDEQLAIRQRQYANEHGETVLRVSESGEKLDVTLEIEGDSNSVTIQKTHSSHPVLLNAQDRGTAHDLELLGAALQGGFPWAEECLVATYSGEIEPTGNEYYDSEDILFTTYTPPRGIVEERDADEMADFVSHAHATSLDTATRTHLPPNPWTYASTAVIYENTSLAYDVLSSSPNWESGPFDVAVTYPDRLDRQ